LDILTDVTAPPDTPGGKFLGTTTAGVWAPVDPPQPTLDGYALLSGAEFTGPVGIGAESPAATLGPDLGTGTGLTQTVTTVVGRTYIAGGTGVQGFHIDDELQERPVWNGWTAFVATATSHTLVGRGGTVLEVREVTLQSVPPLLTVGDAIEVRRAGSNTGIGSDSHSSLVHGFGNTAVGDSAQASAVELNSSVAIGANSQQALRSGSGNVAVGSSSQSMMTDGINNTAVGTNTERSLVNGNYNFAVGYGAMSPLQTGVGNTAVGPMTGYSIATGDNNIFVGNTAGMGLQSGDSNVFVGTSTGRSGPNWTGDYNTFIGTSAKTDQAAVSGAVAIGCDSAGDGAVATGSDQIVLGTSRHTVHVPGHGIVINSPNGHKWRITVSDTGVLSATAVT
jgi:hypothetical protein